MSNEYLEAIESELQEITRARNPHYGDFFNMFYYHLGWTDARGNRIQADTGKRIRPLLALWACEAVQGTWRDALPAAAAIELIHNFSLIHDDVQDNSDARRGRPTVWKNWGVPQAINAGDAMFVLAEQALDELPMHMSMERYVGVHRVFHSAIFKLTQGQYLDLMFERADRVTLEQYFEMVRGKTAALVSAACEIGARIGTNEPLLYRTLANYGEHLGIAFQIADDVLGIWGDPNVTGKSAHSDLLARKKSFPVLYAIQTATGNELAALYAKKDWNRSELKRVQDLLSASGAREYAMKQAEHHAREAALALQATKLHNSALRQMHNLIHQMVYREK